MCIVLSSAAHASLATAVFNAVLSNFLGVFVAPATIFLCVGAAAVNVPYLAVVQNLVYKVK
jgi:predicted Na+-dependent transporter